MSNVGNKRNRILESLKTFFMYRRLTLFFIDVAIILLVYGAMLVLDGLAIGSMGRVETPFRIQKILVMYAPVMIFRFAFGIYHCVWRYANVSTYMKLTIADALGATIFFLATRYVDAYKTYYVGFAYTLIIAMLTLMLTFMSRFSYQLIHQLRGRIKANGFAEAVFGEKKDSMHRINVAIIGAGTVGAQLAEELKRTPEAHYYPYCFIDNTKEKIGSSINGIHIYPEDENVVTLIDRLPIQEVIIALPDASREDKERLYKLYSQTSCKVKIYDYPMSAASDADPDAKPVLREFKIEDLLFRKSIDVKSDSAKEYYQGKTILVTGGGGSIGSELCRQIAKLSPKKLIILDIYENNAYEIQQELIRRYKDKLDLEVEIASVRDRTRLEETFGMYHPQVVFHAAAHKHVPLMEHSGCEAIKNNVFGTANVADMAEKYGVERFLLISTDKAVNPTNIMGASKRLCEMVIQSRRESKTCFTAVRFGNVLGSNGSVIPLFKRQIEAGGPVTLTDKRIIRYFMTIPEAVGLVMETCAMAKPGELYVLDMGKPVKILDLAENMIRLSGYKPYTDIDIVEIGLRPGEKLYEELLMKTEELDATENSLIYIERDEPLSKSSMEAKLYKLKAATECADHDRIVEIISETVPTYKRPEVVNSQV